jgi:hypothetical protein
MRPFLTRRVLATSNPFNRLDRSSHHCFAPRMELVRGIWGQISALMSGDNRLRLGPGVPDVLPLSKIGQKTACLCHDAVLADVTESSFGRFHRQNSGRMNVRTDDCRISKSDGLNAFFVSPGRMAVVSSFRCRFTDSAPSSPWTIESKDQGSFRISPKQPFSLSQSIIEAKFRSNGHRHRCWRHRPWP